MFMYRFKIFFWQSPTDYSEGDLPKETRTKVRYSLYDRVITVKARKIMNSYETNDSAFFLLFPLRVSRIPCRG